MTTAAAAPSDICDELPAVTVPFTWNAGLSAASASSEVSARGPSSILKTMSVRFGLLPFGRGEADRHGHDLVVELAGLDGGDGFLVAVDGELVGLLARDVVALRPAARR